MSAQLEKIVTLSAGRSVDIWNASNSTVIRSIPLDATAVGPTILFLDAEHIITFQSQRYMLIINIVTGQIKQKSTLPEPLASVCVSPQRTFLIGGASASGHIYIWHIPTGEMFRRVKAHYKGVSCLHCSNDSSLLISGGLDGHVNVWNLTSLLNIDALYDNSTSSSLLSNATTNTADHVGEQQKPIISFSRHSMPITALVVGMNANNVGSIFTASLDRTVVEYHLPSRSIRRSWLLPAPVTTLCLTPSQTEFYVGCSNHNIYAVATYDTTMYTSYNNIVANSGSAFGKAATNTSNAPSLRSFIGHAGHITSLHVSLQGTYLYSTSTDGFLITWSIASRQIVKQASPTPRDISALVGSTLFIDTGAVLHAQDDLLRKKKWPFFSRDLRLPLPLTQTKNEYRPGLNGLTSIAIVPQPDCAEYLQLTNSLVPAQTFNGFDTDYYESRLLGLVDAGDLESVFDDAGVTVVKQQQTAKSR